MRNKGAVGIILTVFGSSMLFITAHLRGKIINNILLENPSILLIWTLGISDVVRSFVGAFLNSLEQCQIIDIFIVKY